jgi:1-aminocyclopropane-1-carboxylate deaminase/D-cysteine desulfhydrase-like pyridoxal-dependent ACC family enzyme
LQVSKAEYVHHGSEGLAQKLAKQLQSKGLNPYLIPVGGSNALGCWGYMMAFQEIVEQWQGKEPFTHICVVSV